MATQEEVLQALSKVQDPEIHRSITELDMVKDIRINGDTVSVSVALTVAGCPLQAKIREDVRAAVLSVPGVKHVEVNLGVMTDDERMRLTAKLRGGAAPDGPPPILAPGSKTKVIGIASGKGGVGKSTTTVNLAAAMARLGKSVGVLDADIYGFSVSRMLGLSGRPTILDEHTILPMEAHGVKAISMGSLVDEDMPIIWRGPMLGKILDQFLREVYWGDLDYLLIDLPPGTGDVALSLSQMVPQMEIILVTTPQTAAARVAVRAANMAQKTNQRLIGVIENMAYFICGNCAAKHEIFGAGGGEKLAKEIGTELLGRVPLVTAVREGGDAGVPEAVAHPDSPAGKAFDEIARKVTEASRWRRMLPVV